jgi:phosphopantetheine--protein transferase-like protein
MLSNIFKYLDINFNISHSNDMVIIAICKKINVGVDLEYIKDDSINELINNQIFTLEEQEYLCSLSDTPCKIKFYDFWTCKEAVVKLTGKGLSQSLNTIAIVNPHSNNYIIKILDGSYNNNIYFSKKIPDLSNAVAHLVTMYENIDVLIYDFSSAALQQFEI